MKAFIFCGTPHGSRHACTLALALIFTIPAQSAQLWCRGKIINTYVD